MEPRKPIDRRWLWGGTLLLFALVSCVYAPAIGFGFVNYDDPSYVTGNPLVREGITAAGIREAFFGFRAANWHPLTWLSHMLDVELFGLDARGHHAVNLLLHAASAGLLYVFLARTTRRPGPSFFAAALFALHPLRVESVAWVAERKDVLCALFFFLTLHAHEAHARQGGVGRYALVALLLLLGLLAKTMLVTVPVVLLLVDRWPLGRWRAADLLPPRQLVLEKLPLLLLALAVLFLALRAQSQAGATSSLAELPIGLRVENALAALAIYVRQSVAPYGLTVFYPHAALVSSAPARALALPATLGTLLCLGALWVGWRGWKDRPYVLCGVLWTLGMLVPVVGIVQLGSQGHADRYTYLPFVGATFATVFALADLARSRPATGRLLTTIGTLCVAACGCVAWRQVGFWRSDFTLYERALAVTEKNALAHGNLGFALLSAGDPARAATELERAVELDPRDVNAWNNLGLARLRVGAFGPAERALRRAVELDEAHAFAHGNLGELALKTGRPDEAVREYTRGLQLAPGRVGDHVHLGLALVQLKRYAEAEAALEEARRMAPLDPNPLYGLALNAQRRGQPEAARELLRALFRIAPDHAQGRALAKVVEAP